MPDGAMQNAEPQQQPSTRKLSLDLTNTAILSLTELRPYKFEDLVLLNFAEKNAAYGCKINVAGQLTLDPDTDVANFEGYNKLCVKYEDCADLQCPTFDVSRIGPKRTLQQLQLHNLQQVMNTDSIKELISLEQLEIVNC